MEEFEIKYDSLISFICILETFCCCLLTQVFCFKIESVNLNIFEIKLKMIIFQIPLHFFKHLCHHLLSSFVSRGFLCLRKYGIL